MSFFTALRAQYVRPALGICALLLGLTLVACASPPKPEIKPARKPVADPVACKRDCFDDRAACYNRELAWRCENDYAVCMEACTP